MDKFLAFFTYFAVVVCWAGKHWWKHWGRVALVALLTGLISFFVGFFFHARLAEWPAFQAVAGDAMPKLYQYICYSAIPPLIVGIAVFAFYLLIGPSQIHLEQQTEISSLTPDATAYRLQVHDPATSPPPSPVPPAPTAPPGMRVVEKARATGNGRTMIEELINDAPSCKPLDRKAVAKWRDRVITTLQELLDDSHQDTWLKVHAALYGVEKTSIQTAQEVKDNVDKVLVQLRALHGRYDHTMVRRKSSLTNGEYNRIYPDDRDTGSTPDDEAAE
jgi:hypothetical protein